MKSKWLHMVVAAVFLISCQRGTSQHMDVNTVKAVLLAYSEAPSDEAALVFLTGREKKFLEQVIEDRKLGRPHSAFQWVLDEDSKVEVLESSGDEAVVQLTYRNSFTSKEESMKFKLQFEEGRWLIENHSNRSGVWWPDYLSPQTNKDIPITS